MLFGTWSQAHAYDPSNYMETRLKSHTVSKKLEHTEMACLLSWMSGKETSAKKTLFSQGERLMDRRITITEDSSSYLFLMLIFQINSLSMMKEMLGVK